MSGTVLITGAATGIGRDTARRFAAEGWNVAVHYHSSADKAAALVDELKARRVSVIRVAADVRDANAVRAMADKVCRAFGRIDALVNNAGIAQQKLFTDITDEDWDVMMDVNVKGVFHCCQAVLPGMISRKSGSIVNVSSMWGVAGASCEVHYSAAKAAVIGLTKALAKEVGPSGIRVNCVAPGVIATPMTANLDAEAMDALKDETPLGVIGTPRDVGDAIYYLASSRSSFVTGQVLGVNGGFVI
jgi:3-oxoacyl-[acyl-carrier protein] reductase